MLLDNELVKSGEWMQGSNGIIGSITLSCLFLSLTSMNSTTKLRKKCNLICLNTTAVSFHLGACFLRMCNAEASSLHPSNWIYGGQGGERVGPHVELLSLAIFNPSGCSSDGLTVQLGLQSQEKKTKGKITIRLTHLQFLWHNSKHIYCLWNEVVFWASLKCSHLLWITLKFFMKHIWSLEHFPTVCQLNSSIWSPNTSINPSFIIVLRDYNINTQKFIHKQNNSAPPLG